MIGHSPRQLGASVGRAYLSALRATPPLWVAAALIVLGELLAAASHAHSAALAGLALAAPGWALTPLMPAALRRHALAAFAAGPALGAASVSVVIITLARIGVHLDATTIGAALLVLIILALPTWHDYQPQRRRPTQNDVLEALGLLGAIVLGVVLAWRVVGFTIPPGNDWAKYLLYAEQVRVHGSLLIQNPFWLLGQPFRDDPGIPSLYGAVLILARAPANVLTHGILIFEVLEFTTVYAFARSFWGRRAGVLAALLVAVVPASQDMLGWYGLANLDALVLMALLFCYLAAFTGAPAHGEQTATRLNIRGLVGLALTLLGLIAAHRLTGVIGLGISGLIGLGSVAARASRRQTLLDGLKIVALVVVGGAGVLADIYARERSFGGSLPYTDYLDTKLNLSLGLRDISPMLAGASVIALVLVAWRYRGERALWAPLALLAFSVVLTYAYLAHIPNYYARMVFYVPLAAAPLVAAIAVRLPWQRSVAAAAVIGIGLTAVSAYGQAAQVRSYYAYVTPTSLRGLDALATQLRPNEVVVTDRCWSFVGAWLLHTRTLAALEPQDIQPAAELPFAREAQAILSGTAAGNALVRKLGVRFLVVDPTCPSAAGTPLPPPAIGTPIYESSRLAILRITR